MHTYWLNIRVVVDIVSFAQIGRYLFIYVYSHVITTVTIQFKQSVSIYYLSVRATFFEDPFFNNNRKRQKHQKYLFCWENF